MENGKVDDGELGWPTLWEEELVPQDMTDITQLHSGFNTSFMLPFEMYDERHFYRWAMPSNWRLCFVFSAVYIVVIFGGRRLMEKRPRFELRTALTAWNLGLAIFSICGALRMNQEMLHTLHTHGFEYSFCVPSYGPPPFGIWVVMFAVSKVVEFGDTVFIVLRKQPLIFLHWYHHIATLIYTWVAYTERMSSGRWFITMNYTVHAFMYLYYAARALRVKVPRSINVCITSMQTLQMVVGLVVNYGVILVKRRGDHCQQSYGNVIFCLLMYFSYFLLFSWYFYNAYIRARPKQAPKVYQNGIYINGVSNGVSNGMKKYN